MSCYKIYDFFPYKTIKQYIIGLNNVKMCCSNQRLPFGTSKSVKSSKIFFLLFFKRLIFSPSPNPLISFPPPPWEGGGNVQLYTRLATILLELFNGIHFKAYFLINDILNNISKFVIHICSRVLRDFTPRFVSLSVHWSVSPSHMS